MRIADIKLATIAAAAAFTVVLLGCAAAPAAAGLTGHSAHSLAATAPAGGGAWGPSSRHVTNGNNDPWD